MFSGSMRQQSLAFSRSRRTGAATLAWPFRIGTHGSLRTNANNSRHTHPTLESLESRQVLAGDPILVRDLQVGQDVAATSTPRDYVQVGGDVYFLAERDAVSRDDALWRFRPTTGELAEAAFPGLSQPPVQMRSLESATLLFVDDGVHGTELWRTDGTAQGTSLIKDLLPGPAGALELSTIFQTIDGHLYFSAATEDGQYRVWRSDGTEAGTESVAGPFSSGSTFAFPTGAHTVSIDFDTVRNEEGTKLLEVSFPETLMRPFAMNGRVYVEKFEMFGRKRSLWESDGTVTGTKLVAALPNEISQPVVWNDQMFFMAGQELWASDGTNAGTRVIWDFGVEAANWQGIEVALGGDFVHVIAALDFQGPSKIWKFDTTVGSLDEVATLPVNLLPTFGTISTFQGQWFFTADDSIHGSEPWTSDLTSAGTQMIADIAAAPLDGFPTDLHVLMNRLYLDSHVGPWQVQDNVVSLPEVPIPVDAVEYRGKAFWIDQGKAWVSDGTVAGTESIVEFSAFSENVEKPIVVEDKILFIVMRFDGTDARELWQSEGTAETTARIAILPLQATNLTPIGDALYFTVDGALWGHDAEGDHLIKNFQDPNTFFGDELDNLVNINGTLVFEGFRYGPTGFMISELWKSDGTPEGTVLITDLGFESSDSITSLTQINGEIYFSQITNGTVWRSDGTAEGTYPLRQVATVLPETSYSLFALNGQLAMASFDEKSRTHSLWTTDGTNEGTQRVSSLPSYSNGFQQLGDRLYFAASDVEHGVELWAIDLADESDDLNHDGQVSSLDLDVLCSAVLLGNAARVQVEDFLTRNDSAQGDANLDHRFDSSDLIEAFQAGRYESGQAAVWSQGDWNCDGLFDSTDLVEAFQRGWYESQVGAVKHDHSVDGEMPSS